MQISDGIGEFLYFELIVTLLLLKLLLELILVFYQ